MNTGRIPLAAAAVAAGAAGEYFLDPDNGKRRRHIARDRGLALIRRPVRRVAAEAQRRASYAEGVAQGMVHDATTGGAARDPSRLNDAGLAAKIQSEVFRAADSPKDAVDVNVENGVTYLRGELPSHEAIEGLVDQVRAVDGVGPVQSLLHVPGEPAPARRRG
jgi:osmotically-inducible protein OsmY